MDAGDSYADAGFSGDADAFDLPHINDFPFGGDERMSAPFDSFANDAIELGDGMSMHSDEFVDGVQFMADHRPGEDSFLREATGGDHVPEWDESEDTNYNDGLYGRRASEIFVAKSRDMEDVHFSSPERKVKKSVVIDHRPVPKPKTMQTTASTGLMFSPSNTAMSSEFDIHVDSRLILTPNSMKYLQTQSRNRLAQQDFSLSESKASSTVSIRDGHSNLAKQVVSSRADALSNIPDIESSLARPSSAEKAMQAGPGAIKKALHEIDALLQPLDYESDDSGVGSTLERLKSRLMESPIPIRLSESLFDGSRTKENSSSADFSGIPEAAYPSRTMENRDIQVDPIDVHDTGVQTDGIGYTVASNEQSAAPMFVSRNYHKTSEASNSPTHETTRHIGAIFTTDSSRPKPEVDRRVEDSVQVSADRGISNRNTALSEPATVSDPILSTTSTHVPARPPRSQHKGSFRSTAFRESLDASDCVRRLLDADIRHAEAQSEGVAVSRPSERNAGVRTVLSSKADPSTTVSTEVTLPVAATTPTQVARRCRRFLCTLGEVMTEDILFSNGSNRVGRICVSILPLSTGCQQFSVTPAVLELQPRSSNTFQVTFEAQKTGVVAGIFQFRAVGRDRLYDPYEILIEASVRGDIRVPRPIQMDKKPPRPAPRAIEERLKEARVTELPSKILAGVQISPTFIRFSTTSAGSRDQEIAQPTPVRIVNTTAGPLNFQVKCPHEHIHVSPMRGTVEAGSTSEISIQPLCQPYGSSSIVNDWCGSLTVIVEDILSRELSVVVNRSVLASLPAFDEMARLRQAISTQTDSFYYTKKVNRRGLYFHARAVECGSCAVGESHQVPVYICNGSDSPMTVFLQALQDPFSCVYQPTTLQARKFIEVPITFKPKAPGKVATCLVAYTVNGKAAVTLIARGVEKSAVRSE